MYYINKPCYEPFIKIIDYRLTVPAGTSAITLEEAKTHLKITSNDYDNQINALIPTVVSYGEKLTGREFINKTFIGYLNCFPYNNNFGLQIRKSKLQNVISVQYYDCNGNDTTIDPVNYYITNTDNGFDSIFLKQDFHYPQVEKRVQNIRITFTAGYGNSSNDVPEYLKTAMLQHLTLLFENLGDCEVMDRSNILFRRLYEPYIIYELLPI